LVYRFELVPTTDVIMEKAGVVNVCVGQADQSGFADRVGMLGELNSQVDLGKEIFDGLAGMPWLV
jgi:hypothetical protein